MPNIREYNAPVDKLNPTEAGAAAYELEGRHIGADIDIAGRYIGGALGQAGEAYDRHQDIQDVSALTQQASKSTLALDDAWNQTLSSAGPDTDLHALRDQFMQDQVGKHTQDLKDAAKTDKGRAYAERWADETFNQFGRSATADIMNASGQFAVQGLHQLITDQGQRAYNNPENLDAVLQFADGSVGHIKDSHDMKGVKGADFDQLYMTQERPKIILNAMQGALVKNPQQFADDLNAGKYDKYGISAQEKLTLQARATSAVDMQQRQDEALRKRVSDSAVADYHSNMFDANGKFVMPKNGNFLSVIGQINKDQRLTPEAQETLSRYVYGMYQDTVVAPIREKRADEREARAEMRQDNAVRGQHQEEVSRAITEGRITDPIQIYDRANNGLLDRKDVPGMVAELEHMTKGGDRTDPGGHFQDKAYKVIEQNFKNEGNDEGYNQAYLHFHAIDLQEQNQNIPAQERYDPNSKYYIGRGLTYALPEEPTNPATSPATAVPPKAAPTAASLGLDKIPRGEKGSQQGIDIIKKAVKAGMPRDKAEQELISRGWASPATAKPRAAVIGPQVPNAQ